MDVRKFGVTEENDSVRSCKSGISYRKSLVCECKYRKSQQNLKCDDPSLLFERFETRTTGLVMGMSSVSLTGAMIPCCSNLSK